jgi:ribose/xylose/arabinose/galactoside ABC-type transport system permease subunit
VAAVRTLAASLTVPLWAWANLRLTQPAPDAGAGLHVAWLAAVVVGGATIFWLAGALVRAPERASIARLLRR